MINILYIIEKLPIGGAEKLLLTLAKNIDRAKFKLIFCCLKGEGYVADRLKYEGFKVVRLKNCRIRHFYKRIIDIVKLIRSENIDIVHTHLIGANLWGRIGALMSYKRVTVCKSEHALLLEFWGSNVFKNKLYLIANKILDKFSDTIIYVSEFQRCLFNNSKYNSFKHILIPNAVDEMHFTITKDRDTLRRSYGFSETETIIGIVGRLVRHKGHGYLFRACKMITKKHLPVKLLVVGIGPEENRLKKFARKLDINVVFLLNREDIPELMKTMDIYVQPSLRESFGITIAEAMYSELPVIASNVGGIPELIQNDINGILVEPRNSRAIADAILELIENPAKANKIASEGRKDACLRYTGKTYAEKTANLYQRLVEEKIDKKIKRKRNVLTA